MNVVDWILIGAIAVFAIVGWHRGFVAGLLSFAGFLGGGLTAAFLLPPVVVTFVDSESLRIVIVVVGVLVFALVGQAAASMVGDRIHASLSARPVKLLDNVGGVVLNVLALALVAWIIASALAFLPSSSVAQQVTGSRVLIALDSLVPDPARDAFGHLRDLVGTSSVPRVFTGLSQVTGPDVAEPDMAAVTPAVVAAQDSIVRVSGKVDECGAKLTGSGFVFAPGRVLTNAHVVAGVAKPTVDFVSGRVRLRASVVYFDPDTDVAVLSVPGLEAAALPFSTTPAGSGDSAAVAGYPLGGHYVVEPARVRMIVEARGEDIYGEPGVQREVYSLRALVQAGNSGGPLLDPEGRVLGMVFGASELGGDTGFALTNEELGHALAVGIRASEPVVTGPCLIHGE